MTLFISWLIIAGFGFHPIWYFIALLMWMISKLFKKGS